MSIQAIKIAEVQENVEGRNFHAMMLKPTFLDKKMNEIKKLLIVTYFLS